MQLLKQYSNGTWVEIGPDREDEFIEYVLRYEKILFERFGKSFTDRLKREQMTTKKQVLECLKVGKILDYDDEWYAVIKMDLPKKPRPPVEMVKCDCGHTIPKCSVMNASIGTSCPECYDRMSM